ncbi:MAG: GNAT family N-acetyltransferase [Anaerolineales bacterium]
MVDPKRGPFFQRGEAEFFLAWRDGQPVGTICAAEDRITNQERALEDCILGFFESVDDYAVAKAMLDHVRAWGQARGLKTLYGPWNLDYEDGYGVLLAGRDRPPAVLCGHTPPYYQGFFEQYGFLPARGENIAYAIEIESDLPERIRLSRVADRLRQRGWIRVRGADLTHWREEIDRVFSLINRALAHLPDFIPWQREALHASLEPFVGIVDPDLILFAEVKGETVGWFPGIPNLNEVLIHLNGLRYPWDYLRYLRYSRLKPQCLAIKSVLVLPEYWDTGVAVLLFDEMAKRAKAKGYRWADLSLTSSDNPYTPALAQRFGAKLYKRYQVYRMPI